MSFEGVTAPTSTDKPEFASHRYDLDEILRRSGRKPDDLRKVLAELPDASPSGPWIAGGIFRRSLLGQPLDSDVDVFFASDEQRLRFTGALESLKFEKVRENDHVSKWKSGKGVRVDVIKFREYTGLDDVLDSFDFTLCQVGWDGERLAVGHYTLWDLARRRVAVHRITYAASSTRRLLKYASQGFTVCQGAAAALLRSVADHPETIREEVEYVD